NEAETRRYLIDVLLKETGWDINQPGWTEYEVEGMPNETGKGRCNWLIDWTMVKILNLWQIQNRLNLIMSHNQKLLRKQLR
ncbi:MAG: hypothetical protein HC908_15475, partial [Calothrix sp. SM1_7_51]|nr:hypothetical protein [Calothrix sp. SM1_7_51]